MFGFVGCDAPDFGGRRRGALTLFAWPGIGHALVHAIFGRVVPMIQGGVLTISLTFAGMTRASHYIDIAGLMAQRGVTQPIPTSV